MLSGYRASNIWISSFATARDSTSAAFDDWYDYSLTSHLLLPRPRTYAIRTADGRLQREGIKTDVTDYQVTRKWSDTHLQIGIEAMTEIGVDEIVLRPQPLVDLRLFEQRRDAQCDAHIDQ